MKQRVTDNEARVYGQLVRLKIKPGSSGEAEMTSITDVLPMLKQHAEL